jgi:hypothetical protein
MTVFGEVINRLEPEQIQQHLAATYNEIHVDLTQYEKGEILVDSRSKGSAQV